MIKLKLKKKPNESDLMFALWVTLIFAGVVGLVGLVGELVGKSEARSIYNMYTTQELLRR